MIAVPIGVLAMVLSSIGINRQMWIDEYVTYYVTQLTWEQFRHLMGNQDLVHGAYYTFMRLWTSAAGTSLVTLRLPSIIAMGLTAGALTLLGRRLFSTRVGLLAGVVFAVLPTVSRYGQEVRSYAMVSALVILATLVLTYAIEHPGVHRWLLYTVVTVALVYVHVVAALILLPHALLVLHGWRRERERGLFWWLLCAFGVVAAAAPLLYFARGQSGQVDWVTADIAAVQRYPADLFGSALIAAAVALAAIAGIIQLARRRAGNMFAVLVWAVVPPVFCYLSYDIVPVFLAKYALFVLPAWSLLVGGVLGVPAPATEPAPQPGAAPWTVPTRAKWLGRPAAAVGVLVAALVAVAGFTAQQEVRRSPLTGEPAFREAAAIVDQGFQAGDGIVYVGTYRWARLPFRYELRSATPKDTFASVSPADNGWFYPQECDDPAACLGDAARIWLVVSNYSDNNFTGLPEGQAELLKRQYEVAGTTPLDNIRVVLLHRRPPENR